MRTLIFLLSLALTPFVLAGEIRNAIPPACRQLVLVTAPDWNSPHGELRRYERASGGWQPVGEMRSVLLGENGLAWGLGLHRVPRDAAPRKREGDRRAPTGVFTLPSAFGMGTRTLVTRLPFHPILPDTEAVDDPSSRFYNQIVERGQVPSPDWHSAERMAQIPDYALGVVIAHNPQNLPGAGSCIFLHEWRGDRAGTAGCTVLRAPHLAELARWLEARKHPVLVQVPRSELPANFP